MLHCPSIPFHCIEATLARRSSAAAFILVQNGFDAVVLDGGTGQKHL
ncbi:MAG: hypothetical protein Q8J66_10660 [Methylotenera sp.]|nr:hypothetical protein [Methylotenera sp.]